MEDIIEFKDECFSRLVYEKVSLRAERCAIDCENLVLNIRHLLQLVCRVTAFEMAKVGQEHGEFAGCGGTLEVFSWFELSVQVCTNVLDSLNFLFSSDFPGLCCKSQSIVDPLCLWLRIRFDKPQVVGSLKNIDDGRDLHLNTTDILCKFRIRSREVY